MEEPTLQSHFIGKGFKSPDGAVPGNRNGIERSGKDYPRGNQIRIIEMNESELLKRRRKRLSPVES
jgi:hypothetical protein